MVILRDQMWQAGSNQVPVRAGSNFSHLGASLVLLCLEKKPFGLQRVVVLSHWRVTSSARPLPLVGNPSGRRGEHLSERDTLINHLHVQIGKLTLQQVWTFLEDEHL